MTTASHQAMHQRLAELLKQLRMPTIRALYHETADAARRESLTHERFLLELVEREHEERTVKRIGRLLHQSRLPQEKLT